MWKFLKIMYNISAISRQWCIVDFRLSGGGSRNLLGKADDNK
jgi:hypothetical protein